MRNGSGTRPLPARAGDEDKAGYDDLTVTLYTSLAVSSSAFNMTTLFKQQASAAGVTVNLNQVSANSFLRAELLHQVSFSQIYYDYSPYLSQVAQNFLPTSPFPETHFNDPTYTNQGRAQVAPPRSRERRYASPGPSSRDEALNVCAGESGGQGRGRTADLPLSGAFPAWPHVAGRGPDGQSSCGNHGSLSPDVAWRLPALAPRLAPQSR
jgi:hypothetical protein